MKKSMLFFLSLFLINFVSAQFFGRYGGYGRFSLADFFDSVDPSTVVYGLLFFILFTLIFLALSRMNLFRQAKTPWGEHGRPNTAAAGVVAFAISAMTVYYIYRSGYNLESLLYDIGFSGDLLSLLLAILIVLIAVFLVIRFKLPGFFIVSGLLLILISIFTDLIYEKGIALIIGIILVIIGIFFWKAARKWWRKHIRTY